MTNDIHNFRMQREAMKKDVLFRRQRQEKIEGNLRMTSQELEKAVYEQEEHSKQLGMDGSDQSQAREDNKRLKQTIERIRQDHIE